MLCMFDGVDCYVGDVVFDVFFVCIDILICLLLFIDGMCGLFGVCVFDVLLVGVLLV